MKHALAGLALAVFAAAEVRAQSPAWTAIVNVRPEPSPYIADWENDPLMVTLILSYTGSTGVVFHLDGSIVRGSTPIVTGRSTTFEFVRASQLILTARDGIWERNSVTYEAALRDQIERTGRIPDGDYQFCADVREGQAGTSGGALLARDCAAFSITAPQPPTLVSPQDGDSVRAPYPAFVWTPVVTGTTARFTYHVRIARIQPGQTALDALANVPHYEADLTGNALAYPATALPLEDSASYVWQVQALDDAGQPLGERQGKSEAWRFVFSPQGPIVAIADSTRPEPDVGRLRWGGIEVKVLSLADSSRDNYTGIGRVKVVPGSFEPSFEFAGLHVDSAGLVRFAPRHVITIPGGMGVFQRSLHDLRSATLYLDLRELTLVADSGGEHYIAASGSAALDLGLGQADSVAEDTGAMAPPAACTATSVDPAVPLPPQAVVCLTARDALAGADSGRAASTRQDYDAMRGRALSFRLDSLPLDGNGLRGAGRLARGYVTRVFGLGDAAIQVAADSTVLDMSGGNGRLDLRGTFRLPSTAGLVPGPQAVHSNGGGEVPAADSSIAVAIRTVRLSPDGDVVISADGLPRVGIGQSGLHAWSNAISVDLSATESPAGQPAAWRGIVLEDAHVTLPGPWQSATPPPVPAMLIDGSGFTGEAVARGLGLLGAASFNGFAGALDSVRLKFAGGTLDEGYVAGRLQIEVIDGDIPYAAYLTSNGLDRAYTTIDPAQRLPMSGYGASLRIERGHISGVTPDGVLTVDGRLTVSVQDIEVPDVPVTGMLISPDGDIHFQRSGGGGGGSGGPQTEWMVQDWDTQKSMAKYMPFVLDSIGWGRGNNPDERWFGIAAHFALNDNLPYAEGTIRIISQRNPDRHIWQVSHVDIDRLQVIYRNGAVSFRGFVAYTEADSIYGTSFRASLNMSIKNSFSVGGSLIVGATDGPNSFRYWFASANLTLPPPGIQLGPLPLAIWGFKGGAYSRMSAMIDTITYAQTYVPDSTIAFGLKAAISIGTSGNQGYAWNADLWLEAAVNNSGGLESMNLRGNHWFLTEVTNRYQQKLWGSAVLQLPVSQDLVHANLVLNAMMPPYLSGTGWAEMHYEPGNWYVHVGTPTRPDTFTILPQDLAIPGTAYFMLDPEQVSAGFAAHLEREKEWGIFRGRIAGGFEANAQVRYRPFQATGDGELWGEISAEVYAGGHWYELMGGSGRATLHFRFPNPTGVWGRIRLKYRLLHGTVRGTYRARYAWGDTPDANESDADQFTLVAGSYPVANDTAAPLTGFTFYLGMNEGAQYGMDDGVYRLRLSGTPVIERRETPSLVAAPTGPRGQPAPRQAIVTWQSIGALVRDWEEERGTLVLKAPGHATLDPGTRYRVRASFVLEKQDGSSWAPINTADSTIEFTTTGQPALLAALVTATDPAGGASPMYFGGADAGAVRVQFSNTHPDLVSGAVTGRLIAGGTDTVPGSWGTSSYSRAAFPVLGDPTLYAFRPAAGALAPATSYRFAVVSTDSSATEHRSVTFKTSLYATLQEHVAASAQAVTADRGPGPLTSSGSYLLSARVVLAGPEPISWDDIDSIEVTGLTGWEVTPRTRCQWIGGTAPQMPGPGVTRSQLCGDKPTYENVLDIEFSADADDELPPSSTPSLTVRMNHRREGWNSFTFTLPTLATTLAGGAGAAVAPGVGSGQPSVAGAAGQVANAPVQNVQPGIAGPTGPTAPTTLQVPTTIQVTRIRL